MGLLKTAATVAVASSVHGRVQRRQQNRWAAQDQAPGGVPTPAPPAQYAARHSRSRPMPNPPRRHRHQPPRRSQPTWVTGSPS
jgi:hypothetical protein